MIGKAECEKFRRMAALIQSPGSAFKAYSPPSIQHQTESGNAASAGATVATFQNSKSINDLDPSMNVRSFVSVEIKEEPIEISSDEPSTDNSASGAEMVESTQVKTETETNVQEFFIAIPEQKQITDDTNSSVVTCPTEIFPPAHISSQANNTAREMAFKGQVFRCPVETCGFRSVFERGIMLHFGRMHASSCCEMFFELMCGRKPPSVAKDAPVAADRDHNYAEDIQNGEHEEKLDVPVQKQACTPPPKQQDQPLEKKEKFVCTTCSKVFKTEEGRRRHEVNEHLMLFECDRCSMRFINRVMLTEHECKMAAPTSAEANVNDAITRPYVQQPVVKMPPGERPQAHFCPYCPAIYSSQSGFTRHLKKHQVNEETMPKASLKADHRQKLGYTCCICSKQLASKRTLKNHIEKIHKNIQPAHTCHLCGKSFDDAASMLTHVQRQHKLKLPVKTSRAAPVGSVAKTAKSTKGAPTKPSTKPAKSASEAHAKEATRQRKVLFCSKCKAAFFTEAILIQHVLKFHNS